MAETQRRINAVRGLAFDRQLDFIDDPARRKVLLCARRAGKTGADAIYLVQEALRHPNSLCLFACITRDRAKAIMWDGKSGLKWVDRAAQLGLGKWGFNESELTMRFPNGSRIRLFGADATSSEADKVLGDAFRLVILDEAASFRRDLRGLVYDKIKPAVADLDGTMCLTGTPGDFIGPSDDRHLFYELTAAPPDDGWSPDPRGLPWRYHSWSTLDNPHMREKRLREIEEIERHNPLYKETAGFKIMYLNEWAIDESRIVYRYNADRNVAVTIPTLTDFVIGVDLGHEDASAFVVVGWNEYDKTLYVLRAFKQSKMTLEDVAREVNALRETYKNCRIVVDGAAKQAVEDMRQRHGIPFNAAEKAGKTDFIRMMNTDLICAKIKLAPSVTDALVDEWQNLIWDAAAQIKKELDSCENHLSDAMLYAWRFSRAYRSEAPEDTKSPTADEQVQAFWTREREKRSHDADEDGLQVWAG